MEYGGGLEKILIDLLSNFEFKLYPDELKDRGVDDCPFLVVSTDGVELREILCDYVSDFIDEIYEDQAALEADISMKKAWDFLSYGNMRKGLPIAYTLENVKKVWGEILFRVTGYHSSGELFLLVC